MYEFGCLDKDLCIDNTTLLRKLYISTLNEDVSDDTVDIVALEGFFSNMFDSILGIFNNIKHVINSFGKEKIRSETHYYITNNMTKTKRIFGLLYTDTANEEMELPVGMKVPYSRAVETLNILVEEIDIFSKIENIKNYLNSLTQKILIDETITDLLKRAYIPLNAKTKSSLDIKMKNIRDLGAKTKPIIFSDVFSSMKDFEEVKDAIINMNDTFSVLNHIQTHINEIEKYTDTIIRHIKDQADAKNIIKITKRDILIMSNIVYSYAELFTMFSDIADVYYRTDHNYVECMKRLSKKINR